jgi:hypothetical protein
MSLFTDPCFVNLVIVILQRCGSGFQVAFAGLDYYFPFFFINEMFLLVTVVVSKLLSCCMFLCGIPLVRIYSTTSRVRI